MNADDADQIRCCTEIDGEQRN